MGLSFELLREVSTEHGVARRGRLETPHGVVETPAFLPVGTLGAVKGLSAPALEEAGAEIMLANLYHLALRPGVDVIESLGGLHAFSGWTRPLLSDSGGYQIFSLSETRRIDDAGVTFRSVHDGSPMRFTPESVVADQRRLGVDLAMVLDECPPWPIAKEQAIAALRRTREWARRSAEEDARRSVAGGLFGIVQGSFFEDLRERAALELRELPFAGFAIGGVSVGEASSLGREVVRRVVPLLPAERPRYLMGLGTLEDLRHGISAGVDLFDCVLPSRNARHGFLFTRAGVVRIKNARYQRDPAPIADDCDCTTCRRHSRAFLHHLFRAREITGKVLATVHNVRVYLDFMERTRKALELGSLESEAFGMPALRRDGAP
ncbi:MAG TPA: tRNA guanosine(34) transglycosylase Tgt [Thermoanaerobaculia bacterium]|nr:tRNA guanosine(34) transglycosylase Tgt [Thermoanaerobaculia bacterium]